MANSVTVEPLWTTSEVARYVRRPARWIRMVAVRELGLPAIPLGRRLRFQPAAVRAWLHRQAAGTDRVRTTRASGCRAVPLWDGIDRMGQSRDRGVSDE